MILKLAMRIPWFYFFEKRVSLNRRIEAFLYSVINCVLDSSPSNGKISMIKAFIKYIQESCNDSPYVTNTNRVKVYVYKRESKRDNLKNAVS